MDHAMTPAATIRDPEHFTVHEWTDGRGRRTFTYQCTACPWHAINFSAVTAYADTDEHWHTDHKDQL